MSIGVVCALDPTWRGRELKNLLAPSHVILAASAIEIDAALRAQPTGMVIACTHLLASPIEDWIREVQGLPERPDVVLVHDQEDAKFRAAALRAGCLAVLSSTLSIDELAETIQALIQRRVNLVCLIHATSPMSESRLLDFVSPSPRMEELTALARRVANSGSSLLLLGETGTGKERLARAVHEEGPRSAGPFVAVNCGAFPETLFESELFGHEKGAFHRSLPAAQGILRAGRRGHPFPR